MPKLNSGLPARGLRSAVELGAHREHGERLRYLAGCRCFKCRRANSDYERKRQAARARGEWNGIVPAAKALAHIRQLRRQRIGRRAISAACDVAYTVLCDVLSGRKKQIRAETERRILKVTGAAVADGAHVPAAPTWKRIDELVAMGYPKRFLARQLGYAAAIQFSKKLVTAKNEYRVQKLHARLMTPEALETLRSDRAKIKRQPAVIVHVLEDD